MVYKHLLFIAVLLCYCKCDQWLKDAVNNPRTETYPSGSQADYENRDWRLKLLDYPRPVVCLMTSRCLRVIRMVLMLPLVYGKNLKL